MKNYLDRARDLFKVALLESNGQAREKAKLDALEYLVGSLDSATRDLGFTFERTAKHSWTVVAPAVANFPAARALVSFLNDEKVHVTDPEGAVEHEPAIVFDPADLQWVADEREEASPVELLAQALVDVLFPHLRTPSDPAA